MRLLGYAVLLAGFAAAVYTKQVQGYGLGFSNALLLTAMVVLARRRGRRQP